MKKTSRIIRKGGWEFETYKVEIPEDAEYTQMMDGPLAWSTYVNGEIILRVRYIRNSEPKRANWYHRIKTGQNYSLEPSSIEIQKYKNTRFWGIYVDSELVCLCVYKKGAIEVRNLLEKMMRELSECRGEKEAYASSVPHSS